jgi:PAS domain S-box-containing protein
MKDKVRIRDGEKRIIIFIVFAGIVLISGSIWFNSFQVNKLKIQKHELLETIAKMKVDQITYWVNLRIGEANIIKDSYFLKEYLPLFIKNQNDSSYCMHIKDRLLSFKINFESDDILIVSTEGKLIFSVKSDTTKITPTLESVIRRAVLTKQNITTDFYYCPKHSRIHLDYIIPFTDKADNLIAFIIFRISPEQYIFPLIQNWATPSRTAETVLVERKGDSVVFINRLRHKKNDLLNFSLPLTRKDLPAVKAVTGYRGFFEGNDYRGVPVLCDIRQIPNTPWALITKIDKEELYSDVYFRTITIIVFLVFIFLTISLGFLWYFNSRKKTLYKNLFFTEKDLNKTREEFRTTLYSIGDGVIITDIDGRIRNMNSVAEELTGWTEKEAFGETLNYVFKIINEESRISIESPVDLVLKKGHVVGLANHTVLISKNGNEIPISDSGAPIRNEEGIIIGVVLVFRNQAEERRNENKIRQIADELQSTLDNMINAFVIWESVFNEKGEYISFRFGYFNEAYANISKLKYFEVKGKDVFEVWPDTEQSWLDIYKEVALTGINKTFEMYHKPTNGFYHCNAFRPRESADKICVIFEDITIRKQAELALKESEERLYSIIQSTPMGIHIYRLEQDNRLIFEGANNAANKILGVDHTFFVGKTIEEAFPPLINTEVPDKYRQTASKGIPWETESIEYKDNAIIGAFEVYTFQISPNRMAAQFHDVTARKQAEEKVRKTQMLLQSSIESPKDVIIYSLDEQYRLLCYNTLLRDVMKNLYGTDIGIGMSLLDCIADELDKRKSKDAFDRALAGENHIAINVFGNIEQRYYETRYSPIIDDRGKILGATAYSVDITERKKMEEALKQSEERFRISFITNPDSININRLNDGMFININDGFTKLTGYTFDDIKDKTSREINIWAYSNDRDYLVNQLSEHGYIENYEAEFRLKNGDIITGLMSARIMKLDNIPHIISITRDITERKKAIEEINRLNSELEQRVIDRTTQLVEANRELEAFAYTVSHDLRAPLRAIDGFARILAEDYAAKIDSEAIRICSVIKENAIRMGTLIDDLLAFSRLGRTEMNWNSFDMRAIIDSVLNDIFPHGINPNLKINIKELENNYGDHIMMKQVWMNLILNAIKFSSKKTNPEIFIKSEKAGNDIIYSITDNGAGFDPKYMNKLFGVFQRLHSQSDFEGTGVGLAIVQRIVMRHGGKVWADGEPDKGATFYFSLPEKSKN